MLQENVFIDEHERAVVGDIGLAFLNDESYQPTRTASASRAISTGTVRYMAPELLQDKYRRSTEETDIYALGMTIYDVSADMHVIDQAIDAVLDTYRI